MPAVALAAVAVAIGTLVGHGRPAVAWPFAAASALLVTAALVWRTEARRVVALALCALCASAGASAAWRTAATRDAVLPRLADGGVVEVCGFARSLRARSFEMRVDRVETTGGARSATPSGITKEVRSRAWETSEPLRVTGRVAASVRPGESLCAKGEIARPREGRDEPPLLVAEAIGERRSASVVRLAAASVRARFARSAAEALPKTQAGLLLGMTEGDVALLDEATVEAFRTTGLAHLVAVSGSNVAVVLTVVMLVARRVFLHRRWMHLAIALPALAFFAFLTGLEASVLRAVVTAAIALFATVEGRATDGIRLASLAFVVLVLASPELLFHPGFQLSFAATLGLILWARPLTDLIARRMPGRTLFVAVAACVGTTLAAQAAAAPLLAWHFGRIPALGGVANLVVAPLAPIVMIGGIVTLSAASLVPPVDWAPVLMRLPLDAILWCGRTFARLPAASLDATFVAGLAIAAIPAVIVARSPRARTAAIALILVAWTAARGSALAGGTCEGDAIVALDVGQGTAVLLRAAGHDVLVDGGPDDGDVVSDLREQGVGVLDAVFVSHPHADHTQGVVDVLGSLEVGALIAPFTIGWGTGGDVVRAARAAGVPVVHTSSGDVHRFGPGLEVDVVFPDTLEVPLRTEEAVHANSLVLRASVGGADVLLPGDIGAEEERDILEADVASSILVAPHHGSKDLDPTFVDAVAPRIVLVTVGEHNRYGHPAPEALRAYAAHGRVFRTDRHGTVALCGTEDGVAVTTTKEGSI